MDRACATFHLNTSQILTSEVAGAFPVTNSYGSINTFRNDFTWNNVDFKTILGDMYDKYDKFNISLAFITFGATAAQYGAFAIDRTLMLNIGGLAFNNCAYNTLTNSNNSSASIGTFTLGANALAGSFNFTNDMNTITIEKPKNMVNLRLFYTRYDTAVPATANMYPAMDFFFHVYGVAETEQ